MAKRKYNKKSDYWKQLSQNSEGAIPTPAVVPELLGEPFYTSDASYGEVSRARNQLSSSQQTATRTNRVAYRNPIDRFSSIRVGMLPYSYSSDGVDVRDGIELEDNIIFGGLK